MYRIIVFSLLSFWLSFACKAQEVTARLEYGKREAKPVFYEYSLKDKGLVAFGPSSARSSRYLSLYKYNQDFEQEWTKQVLEQNGRKNVDFVTIIGENILIFVSEFFPKEKVIKTVYYRYNLQGEVLNEEEILSVYPNQKEQKVDLQYVRSNNKKKLLCYKNLRANKDSEKILYYLFDDSGDFVRNGEIALKYADNRFKIRRVHVSNNGNIFILGKHYLTKRIRDADDFSFLVYRYNVVEEKGEEVPIEIGDRFISDLAFKIDREENIYVAGFYSNRSADRIKGALLQKITPSNEITINTSDEFSEDFLSNFMTSGQINRGKELKNFKLSDIDLRTDGGILLIAEKFFVTTTSYRDFSGRWEERELFHYEDVFFTSISSEGEIEWHGIVNKDQVGEVRERLSYFKATSGTSTYLFYEYKPHRQAVNVYYSTVGITGQVETRKALFDDYTFNDEYYPAFCEQVTNNEAIMVYYRNRGKTLSVIKVKLR